MSVCTSMVMFSVISYSCSVCSYYTCSHCDRIPCRDSEYLKTFHLSLNRERNELQMGLGWKVWTKVEKIMYLWWFRIICLFCMEVLGFFKAEILHWSMTPLSFSVFLNSLLVLEFHCVWWLSETIFCFLFFAASLLLSKFCWSILNQSITCFPSCIYCPGSHGTENCLTLEKRQRQPGRRWALAGEQTSWSYGT